MKGKPGNPFSVCFVAEGASFEGQQNGKQFDLVD